MMATGGKQKREGYVIRWASSPGLRGVAVVTAMNGAGSLRELKRQQLEIHLKGLVRLPCCARRSR